MRLMATLFVALCICGCAPTKTYQVTVRNDLNQPITVWLTKSGEPAEANWLSPEQIAIGENPAGGRMAGTPLPPGKIAETGKIKGKFPQGTQAVLRIYLGQHTLDELLAINRSNKALRLDLWLDPGSTQLIVREEGGVLVAEPAPGKL
jgi:hypothetical protein